MDNNFDRWDDKDETELDIIMDILAHEHSSDYLFLENEGCNDIT